MTRFFAAYINKITVLNRRREKMKIDTLEKLKVHLKILKKMFVKNGCEEFQLYPMFCLYYDKNKEKYKLTKEQVFDLACEIMIEEGI
jgi:hypothetical protein